MTATSRPGTCRRAHRPRPRWPTGSAGPSTCRLTALAARHGVTYTRYVDDLTFSGPAATAVANLVAVGGNHRAGRGIPARVDEDPGATVVRPATRAGRGRQPPPDAVAADRDVLKATVHNCRVHGWRSQLRDEPADGFRERLTGRVAWLAALDPVRGRRLLTELAAVDWS